jgi:hypothetical protein
MPRPILWCVVFAAAACAPAPRGASVPTRVERDGLVFQGVSTMTPDSSRVFVAVRITNNGRQTRTVQFPDGCVVLLRLARDSTVARPVWDQSRVAMCTQGLVGVELRPREAISYSGSAAVAEIRSDSVPPGRYFVVAFLRPNGDSVRVPAGAVVLPRAR